MKRREFVVALGGAVISAPLDAWAQRAVPIVGVLSPFNDAESTLLADLRAGLRDYGYVDGQNLRIEYRSAEGRLELLPDLISDILRRNADVIVTSSAPAIQAARQVTSKTPIVFARVGDAVNQGIVTSLAHPGGNITGISWFAPELSGKILGILKEAFPGMSHVAIFREAAADAASAVAVNVAAQRLGLKAQIFQARTADELEAAFFAMADAKVDSLVVLEGVIIFNNAKAIAALAEKSKLPAIFFDAAFVDAGGLLSYGPNFSEMHRRTAYFVDRILRGSKPGDLPVEQPTKFDLVINVTAAANLGLTIPPALLLRADRVVE
ncbi:MAG TPA: ABC transporter substrate-binding protein [Bradyrhizobium sp.]|nr:ABC transporter substrate-binding protein [Bradyrhizobium sp.]